MRNLAPISGQDLSAPSPRGSEFGRDDRAKKSVSPITYYFLLITPLLLISSLILLLIWWVFLRERIGYIIANPLMTKHRRIPMRIVGLWFLRSMIVLSLMGIIVGAGKSEVREVIEKKKQNILIVLDISRSMLAEDISPSRIEAAKQTIATFLTER